MTFKSLAIFASFTRHDFLYIFTNNIAFVGFSKPYSSLYTYLHIFNFLLIENNWLIDYFFNRIRTDYLIKEVCIIFIHLFFLAISISFYLLSISFYLFLSFSILMFLEDQIMKAWPLLLSRRYFAIWLLVRAHRGRLLSPALALRRVARRWHPRARFLFAIFTTFLSVTRHEFEPRYVYARGVNDDCASTFDLAKSSLERSARGGYNIYASCQPFQKKNSKIS